MNDKGEDDFFEKIKEAVEKVKEEVEKETEEELIKRQIKEDLERGHIYDITEIMDSEEIVDELNSLELQRALVKIGLWQMEQNNMVLDEIELEKERQEKLQVMLEFWFKNKLPAAWWEWTQR